MKTGPVPEGGAMRRMYTIVEESVDYEGNL